MSEVRLSYTQYIFGVTRRESASAYVKKGGNVQQFTNILIKTNIILAAVEYILIAHNHISIIKHWK